jgi:hypothetical protein
MWVSFLPGDEGRDQEGKSLLQEVRLEALVEAKDKGKAIGP